MSSDILSRLDRIIAERRESAPDESYVARLHASGLNKILEKVGEEATEVILAAKDVGDDAARQAMIGEVADLWFHCLVMLGHLNSNSAQVLECLEGRFGQSGLDEKAARSNAHPRG